MGERLNGNYSFLYHLNFFYIFNVISQEKAEELVVLYVGTPEPNDLMDLSITIGDANETHQEMQGTLQLKLPLTDDMEMEANAFRYLDDEYHLIDNRTIKNACYQWFNEDGLAHAVKTTFIPDIPDRCPQAPGMYNISKVVIPRYREDWDPKMSRLIPPALPKAEKWRVDVKYFDGEKKFVGLVRQEFTLKPKK